MDSIVSAGAGLEKSATGNVVTISLDADTDDVRRGVGSHLWFTEAQGAGGGVGDGDALLRFGDRGRSPCPAEDVEDHVAAFVTGGSGITVSYTDNGSAPGSLTIAADSPNTDSVDEICRQFGSPQCRFVYVSPTKCRLIPCNGSRIMINGSIETVPGAGVEITNAGFSGNYLHYIYAWMDGGTMKLERSNTAFAMDTAGNNAGIMIKKGDSTRTLVGMVYTTSGQEFVDTAQRRLVASYYNRRQRVAKHTESGAVKTRSRTLTEVGSRVEWLSWDEDIPIFHANVGAHGTWHFVEFRLRVDGGLVVTCANTKANGSGEYLSLAQSGNMQGQAFGVGRHYVSGHGLDAGSHGVWFYGQRSFEGFTTMVQFMA